MRLSDIEVDEVSLVDKAANKKKFAFMKRDQSQENNETAKNKEVEKSEEVKEAEKILANTEPTAEEIAKITDLVKQVNELTALVNKK